MDLGLSGKHAVITGASKGIGYGVARSLAAEGCGVTLVSRSPAALEDAADKIRGAYEVPVYWNAADLSTSEGVASVAGLGVPDILVNNAGAIPGGDLLQVEEPRWREAWELKLFGYINLCRALYEGMKERGHGVIVNVTGTASDRYDYNYIAGTTANAGLNAFTRALGGVSIEYGVRVVGVSPGPIQTERLVGLLKTRAEQDGKPEDQWQSYMGGFPTGRAGLVPEVADMVTVLASDRASWVSGTILNVDGGQLSNTGGFGR